MARTIAEIKDGIAGDFMRNEDVARAYGFEAGDSFTAHFSKASVESVLFYIFACAAWIVESLFRRAQAGGELVYRGDFAAPPQMVS